VKRHAQSEVVEECFPLLRHTWGQCRSTVEQLPCLAEDPRIPNASTSNRHGMHASFGEHAKDVRDLKNVAAAKHDAIVVLAGEVLEEWPVRGPDILLLHRSAVDGRPRESNLIRAVKDAFKGFGHFGRIVPGPAELYRARHTGWHSPPNLAKDGECFIGRGEKVTATFTAANLLDGAGKIDIYDIVAEVDQQCSSPAHFVGVCAHDLPCDRVILESGEPIC